MNVLTREEYAEIETLVLHMNSDEEIALALRRLQSVSDSVRAFQKRHFDDDILEFAAFIHKYSTLRKVVKCSFEYSAWMSCELECDDEIDETSIDEFVASNFEPENADSVDSASVSVRDFIIEEQRRMISYDMYR